MENRRPAGAQHDDVDRPSFRVRMTRPVRLRVSPLHAGRRMRATDARGGAKGLAGLPCRFSCACPAAINPDQRRSGNTEISIKVCPAAVCRVTPRRVCIRFSARCGWDYLPVGRIPAQFA